MVPLLYRAGRRRAIMIFKEGCSTMRKSRYLLLLCGSVLAFTAAAQTSPPQMTARELFYAAAPADAQPAASASKKKAPTGKPQERAQPASEVAVTPPEIGRAHV